MGGWTVIVQVSSGGVLRMFARLGGHLTHQRGDVPGSIDNRELDHALLLLLGVSV